MMKSRNQYMMLLAIAVVAVAGVAVAYAAMSTVLTITTNKVTQTACSSCTLGFTGSSATGTKGGSSTGTVTCGSASITPTAIKVGDIALAKPDDSCTYTFSIANTYPFAWNIASIVPTSAGGTGVTCTPTSASTSVGAKLVCGNITYTITTDGSTPLKTGQTIAATSGTQAVVLTVKFTGSAPVTTAVVQTNALFTFTYAQN